MKFRILILLNITFCFLFSCSEEKVTEPIVYAPEISSIYPASAKIGDNISITGNNFDSTQGSSTVKFNFIIANKILKWNKNNIVVKVPEGATTGKLWVIVNGKYSNGLDFQLITSNELTIGNQIWMKKNLDVDRYRNGDLIPQVTNKNQWNSLNTGAWCYYDNNPAMGAVYGKLYNWYAINDPRGLAPDGWHIPTDDEWTILENFLGGKTGAGTKLKSIGTKENNDGLWQIPNSGATNESGFTAQPGGWRNGNFENIGLYGYWWTSTIDSQSSGTLSWIRYLSYCYDFISRDKNKMEVGMSVRCIKN